jgi:hypothetical protein
MRAQVTIKPFVEATAELITHLRSNYSGAAVGIIFDVQLTSILSVGVLHGTNRLETLWWPLCSLAYTITTYKGL